MSLRLMTQMSIAAILAHVNVVDMKKILVVVCTPVGREHRDKLLICSSLSGLNHDVKMEINYNNKESLCVMYNKYINSKFLKKHDIVLFVHDDVYIDDLKIRGKLYGAIERYDLIGLAGCLQPTIKAPALWHKMAPREALRGIVNHPVGDDVNVIQSTSFGPTPSRVVLIDGLFMAVNLKKALDVGWKFNESFKFHHYDIAASLDAHRLKMKTGVIPVNVIHKSKGLKNYNDSGYQESQSKFLDMYS